VSESFGGKIVHWCIGKLKDLGKLSE